MYFSKLLQSYVNPLLSTHAYLRENGVLRSADLVNESYDELILVKPTFPVLPFILANQCLEVVLKNDSVEFDEG